MIATTKPKPPQTTTELTRLLHRNDHAAANALVAMVRAGVEIQPGDDLLLSFAAQVIDRKDGKAAGRLSTDCPLLSRRQLDLWRNKAFKYTAALLLLAGGEPEKSEPAQPAAPAPRSCPVGAILDLFARAAEHLQYPRIRLEAGGKRVVISQAGQKSKYPGALNITDGAPYGENVWYGRVTQDGAFTRGRDCTDEIQALIERFAEQPAEIAAEYGRLTGQCCFCGRHLEDERSTATGYGPICAEHWGLPWGDRPREFAGRAG